MENMIDYHGTPPLGRAQLAMRAWCETLYETIQKHSLVAGGDGAAG
jgi:hypothetical protein